MLGNVTIIPANSKASGLIATCRNVGKRKDAAKMIILENLQTFQKQKESPKKIKCMARKDELKQ